IFNKYTLKALRYKGVMGEKPADKKLTFEFLGDSITAGSCVMSHETEVEDLDLDTSADGYYNYPAVVGRNFDASIRDIAIHGIGVHNREGIFGTNAFSIYEYTECYHAPELKWDFNADPADVVVIGLGTNDWDYNDKPDEYYELAKKLLLLVREKNPGAFIYWIFGMMGENYGKHINTLTKLLENENDGRMKFILMPADFSGGYDHPSKKGQAEFARILTEDIKNTLGY
ncbi:MAG: hypothetical protein E7623_07070, partial [Ruminococcaceae bacterium]|nr:hypothetical protein [Oscillospiraceae bacterium]